MSVEYSWYEQSSPDRTKLDGRRLNNDDSQRSFPWWIFMYIPYVEINPIISAAIFRNVGKRNKTGYRLFCAESKVNQSFAYRICVWLSLYIPVYSLYIVHNLCSTDWSMNHLLPISRLHYRHVTNDNQISISRSKIL